VDVRDIDLTHRDAVLRQIADATEATAARRGVTVHTEMTAPGNTSHTPVVATVSTLPLDFAAASAASAISEAARNASWRSAMRTAPAWPPSPSITTRKLAGAAMAVTAPISSCFFSRIGPCSICSSANVE